MIDILALFSDSQKAGEVIGELKGKGYTDNISIVAKDEKSAETTQHTIKDPVADTSAAGAMVGAAMGGLAALLTGISAVTIPGLGILVAGPLASALTGAVTGGIVGALVDKGIPENKAKEFEDRIKKGEILLSVTVKEDNVNEVQSMLISHGAIDVAVKDENI